MILTLKQLNDCQEAIARVGALTIAPDQAAMAYRMSKNIDKITGDDVKKFQREKLKLLRAFGTERQDTPGFYNLVGPGKEKYDEALDKLEAETVELRIRTVGFLEYLEAIKPAQISPADINALFFIFTFPAGFEEDDDEPKETKKAK